MSAPVLSVTGLSKAYRVYRRRSDWLRERLARRTLHEARTVLEDISFEIAPGQIVGVIGRNGAGKSTLAKTIMGVTLPDRGEISASGRITGLLELGTGFNPTLTGRENIIFNASLIGLEPEEIAARSDAIIAFAELEAAIDEPLRTFSSGMVMRLAFAIAMHADPACFVIDEALSVGDIRFQQKGMARIRAFTAGGGSILFISHDLQAVRALCHQVIVLEGGRMITIDRPEPAINAYYRIIAPEQAGRGDEESARPEEFGSREAEITGGRIVGAESGSNIVKAGERARIELSIIAHQTLAEVTIGFSIRDRFGQELFGINTDYMNIPFSLSAGETRKVAFEAEMNLYPGAYTVSAALHRGPDHLSVCYHWCDSLMTLQIAGIIGDPFIGMIRLTPRFLPDIQEPSP